MDMSIERMKKVSRCNLSSKTHKSIPINRDFQSNFFLIISINNHSTKTFPSHYKKETEDVPIMDIAT